MRRSPLLVWLASAVATTIGLACGSPPEPSAPSSGTTSTASASPEASDASTGAARGGSSDTTDPALAPFCAGGGCGTFDAELAAMQARARGGGACFVAEWGSCGDLRYLDEVPGGLVGAVRYFDASGRLVGATRYNVEHPGRTSFGVAPTCTRHATGDACRDGGR